MRWTDDPYWTVALERYDAARELGDSILTLDLGEIERVAFDPDGPAYRCMHAMGAVLADEGFESYRGAPRVLFALLMRLAEQSTNAMERPEKLWNCRPDEISVVPLSEAPVRRAVRILSMVHELHKAGYQRLRISSGYSLDLQHWRCYIGPASYFHSDGWTPVDISPLLLYTTVHDKNYFGWDDAANDDARRLAVKFIERFPELAQESAGEDWSYAGWFSRILGQAEHGTLPDLFGGRSYHLRREPTAQPPRNRIGDPYVGTGYRLVSHAELSLEDFPSRGCSDDRLWQFCLEFDGYRACTLTGADANTVVAETERDPARATMECLRISAFMLQRAIKWADVWPPEASLLARLHSVIEEMRRRLADRRDSN